MRFRKGNFSQGLRIQAAMEYLTTYGWAILVIALVMFILFQEGIINPYFLTPKASAGSCFVSRPNGAGSTQLAVLSGICNNEIPQFVPVFPGQASTPYVSVPALGLVNVNAINTITMTAWVKLNTIQTGAGVNSNPILSQWQSGSNLVFDWTIDSTGKEEFYAGTQAANSVIGNNALTVSTWYFVTAQYNNPTLTVYINSAQDKAATATGSALSGNYPMWIGGVNNAGSPDSCKCNIANVQIYNTTLTSNEIYALYKEGIGGAPFLIQNLIGWWPLNGNMQDYSGNAYSGISYNGVTFSNTWYTGYTSP